MPTLEELEGENWGEPEHPSYLVTTCHRLRRKDIDHFTVEDLRIMLGQGIGTQFLLPRALDRLEGDPFAEGDFYPGDLLGALTRDANWPTLTAQSSRIRPVLERAIAGLANLIDGRLPDGRFIGSDLQQTLTEQFQACLQNI